MREDFIEKLDQMFPDGYIIVYTCPDHHLRITGYNPHKDKAINKYYNILANESDGGEV